jgi:Zn-dependent protease with chaperone function
MIEATYFDAQTTRRQPVTVVIHQRVVAMRGAGLHRTIRLSQLDISERLQHAPRTLRFPDGGFIEVRNAGLDKLLAANRYRDPWVVRWQQNWLLSLCALITVLVLLISGYQWGLPWTVDKIAQGLPVSMEKKIGDQELKMIDGRYMMPSRLDPAEQARLRQLFSALKQPRGEKTYYRLEFRNSRIGPNAFALPNGVIVMTDQLALLAKNDQALLGVLSHELGHVQRRHSLRHLMQALGVGVVLHLWVGDVSSALVAVPGFFLNQKYSRDFEREADQYAINMMRANGMPLSPLADLFEKMSAAHTDVPVDAAGEDGASDSNGHAADIPGNTPRGDADEAAEANRRQEETSRASPKGDARKAPPEYFSSHPSDAERIARLRAADLNR